MEERWLRPDGKVAVWLPAVLFAGLWVLMSALTAVAAIWWPSHAILNQTPAGWLIGMVEASLVFAAIFGLEWLLARRVTWRVQSDGIEIYRGGKLHRSVGWAEVGDLSIRPFGVMAWMRNRPYLERIHWLPKSDARWLREFARTRIDSGKRLGDPLRLP
jgi:hypothetical protein